jgi:phosphatidylinositol alpha-1,6-mannosyltransferase
MKILVTAYDYLPNLGGISNCTQSILRSLHEQKHQVKLITRQDAPSEAFNVVRIPHHQKTVISAVKMFFSMFQEVIKERPDVNLHFLWWPCAFSSFLLSFIPGKAVPYFIMVHGMEILESESKAGSLIRRVLKKLILSRASGVITVSDFTSGVLHQSIPHLKCKVKTIYHGVDSKYYSPAPKNLELISNHGLAGKKIFLTVARLESYKGIDHAIQALKITIQTLPNLVYLVIGEGKDSDRLKALVKNEKLEKHVLFLGKVPFSKLPEYYRISDCFVLLTRNAFEEPNFEGFGIAILEAAGCEKPSLVGNDSGMLEAIQNEKTGWGVNPQDISGIANQMIQIMSNPVELETKGKLARIAAVEYYQWSRTANEIAGFISQELNG